tara:strand:+ start:401 stop:595 length:195 start_codon:yes stop_codon:yes gene_type:complete
MKDKFKCNPTGNCWCKKIPYKIEVSGDECFEPEALIDEIKKRYKLTKKEIERLMLIINEENKNI